MPPAPPSSAPDPLRALAERWAGAKPAERANTPMFVAELCAALGVEPPSRRSPRCARSPARAR